MTLSALRTNLPLRLALPHYTSAGIKIKDVTPISSPDPHNSMFLLTSSLLMHSCVEMAYAYGPHMLARDRRVLDISLEERLYFQLCSYIP
jgi:hypothetical protein